LVAGGILLACMCTAPGRGAMKIQVQVPVLVQSRYWRYLLVQGRYSRYLWLAGPKCRAGT